MQPQPLIAVSDVEASANMLEAPKVNPSANHREFWLRDPDGYVVVIAGPHGDLGAPPSK